MGARAEASVGFYRSARGAPRPGRPRVKGSRLKPGARASGLDRAVAVLEFLARSAGTRIVAADFLSGARKRRRRRQRLVWRRGQRRIVIGMLVAHVGYRRRLLDRLHVLLGADLHGQNDLDDVLLDAIEHVGKQLERLALVFLLRILLRVAAQMYPLPQMIERAQVLAPVLVERLQHQVALELVEEL